MKRSHFSTPRLLSDCDFQSWGAAVERPYSSSTASFGHRVVGFVCAVIGIPLLLHILYRWGQ